MKPVSMNNRNYSIDILKFVAAVMVVIIHANDWVGHQVLMPLARSAVPCFFMISGYLLYSRGGIGRERLVRNVRHIGVMCAWTLVLFAIVDVASMVYTHTMSVPTAKILLHFFTFNQYPWFVGGHLWYLLAYMYVLVIMVAVDKYRLWRWLFASAPLLLVLYFVVQGMGRSDCTYRNFLFEGLPYFAVGAMVKHWNCHIISRLNRKLFAGGQFSSCFLLTLNRSSQVSFVPKLCVKLITALRFLPFSSCFLRSLQAPQSPIGLRAWAATTLPTYIYSTHFSCVRSSRWRSIICPPLAKQFTGISRHSSYLYAAWG